MRIKRTYDRVLYFVMVIGAAVSGLGLCGNVMAAVQVTEYQLSDHRDGGARQPTYILRLDGLTSRDAADEFTFSVSSLLIPQSDRPSVGVSLFYKFDDTTLDPISVRIVGTAYGGRDVGSDWESGAGAVTGLWDIDFTYTNNLTAAILGPGAGRDDLEVSDDSPPNTGTISPRFPIAGETIDLNAGETIALHDYTGSHAFSFRFNDSEGHRVGGAVEGLFVGYGWLNHGDTTERLASHLAASDWLFEADQFSTLQQVPEPTTFAVWSLLTVIGLVITRRKRKRV